MPETDPAVATAHWWQPLTGDLDALPRADDDARAAALERQATLTKPPGSLGRLEDLAVWLAGWQGREIPRLDAVQAIVFAGNHGVTAQGVSPYPSAVTAQMVANFETGGAAICQLSRAFGADLDVVALDLERPVRDFTASPAMTPQECTDAFSAGRNAVSPATDCLVLGEMGIGNTTAAAALCLALFGGNPAEWAGPGTGLDADGVSRKALVIGQGVDRHKETIRAHPFEALRCLGGRELAALAGAMLEARRRRIPVILDGFVCGAAAAVLCKAGPTALDHCVAGHVSAEPGHRRLLAALGLSPLLDLGMRLGEASGAMTALALLRAAVETHARMATFAEAGVSGRS